MTRSSREVVRTAVLAMVFVTLLPAMANTQTRFEITPLVAGYYPATHLSSGNNGFLAPLLFGNPGDEYTFDQDNAIGIGGRVTLGLSPQFAVEGEFIYSFSDFTYTEQNLYGSGADGGFSQDGDIFHASLRGVFTPRRSNFFVLGGPAIIKRSGDFWDSFDNDKITDFGGVVGVGARANITPSFRMVVTVESYLFSFNPGGNADSEFQSDFLVSIGVPIKLGGN